MALSNSRFVTLVKIKRDGIKLDYNWRSARIGNCSSFFSNEKKLERRKRLRKFLKRQ